MAIKSILKPQGSIISGIATAGLVAIIFSQQLPTSAVIHATSPANDSNIDAARKKATYSSIGVISIITLLTRDANIFVLGGLTAIALDFNARHANASNAATQQLVSGTDAGPNQLRAVQ